jgi:hypothetical protein
MPHFKRALQIQSWLTEKYEEKFTNWLRLSIKSAFCLPPPFFCCLINPCSFVDSKQLHRDQQTTLLTPAWQQQYCVDSKTHLNNLCNTFMWWLNSTLCQRPSVISPRRSQPETNCHDRKSVQASLFLSCVCDDEWRMKMAIKFIFLIHKYCFFWRKS